MLTTSYFRAVTILVAMAVAAVLLLSSTLLWSPKTASAQETPDCVPAPDGLAAWWRWKGDGRDSANGNTATFFNEPTFEAGKVGQALQFDGQDDYAKASASSTLDVGSGTDTGLTIEAWIKPNDNIEKPLVEWNNNAAGGVGAHLWASHPAPGYLYANLKDTAGSDRVIYGPGISTTAYQHVALTYHKASGYAKLYRDGNLIVQRYLGTFTPRTTYDLYFGKRPLSTYAPFTGGMDEVSIYNRALEQSEIRAIHTADSAGKCPLDTTAPLVSSVFPVKAATKVPRDTQPTATFSEEMKPDTLSTANVKMTNQNTKKRVPLRLSCDDPCTTVTLDPYPSDPSKLLAKRTKHKIVILGGASGPQDLEDIPLEKSEVWTFTTGRK